MSELKKAKPEIYVKLGGKVRKLLFSLWAKAAIQEDKGRDFLPSINYQEPNIHEINILLWACLLDGSPELDGGTPAERRKAQKKVMGWLDGLEDYSELVSKLFQAILNSMPKQENSEEDKTEGEDGQEKKPETDDQKNSPS